MPNRYEANMDPDDRKAMHALGFPQPVRTVAPPPRDAPADEGRIDVFTSDIEQALTDELANRPQPVQAGGNEPDGPAPAKSIDHPDPPPPQKVHGLDEDSRPPDELVGHATPQPPPELPQELTEGPIGDEPPEAEPPPFTGIPVNPPGPDPHAVPGEPDPFAPDNGGDGAGGDTLTEIKDLLVALLTEAVQINQAVQQMANRAEDDEEFPQ